MYPSLRLHVSVTTTPCICHYDSMYPSLRLPFPYYTSTMCVSELFLTCTSLATQSRVIIVLLPLLCVCPPPHSLCAVPYCPHNTEPYYLIENGVDKNTNVRLSEVGMEMGVGFKWIFTGTGEAIVSRIITAGSNICMIISRILVYVFLWVCECLSLLPLPPESCLRF